MLNPPARDRRRRGRRDGSGFTLIELLTTLCLLGVLMQLSLPSFMTWIGNAQVRTVADSLQNGVRLAQAEAVRRNRQVVLSFTDRTPALSVPAVAGGANWSIQTVAQFGGADAEFVQGGKLTDVATGVSIGAIGPAVTALCFNSNGRLTVNAAPGPAGAACRAAAATFEMNRANADRRLRIVVGVGGQLRMCDPSRPPLSSTSPDGCP